jgi:hypothetical protein
MKTTEIKVASKGAQAINFKLSHKFTVFLWDSNYLDHLDEIGADKPESSFVFGLSNKKYLHPTAFYIASVMSSILHRTNDSNPRIAKIATEMTHLFNDDLALVYDDLYAEAQKIKQRLADEESLFDGNENNVSEVFARKELQSFNLVMTPRIVTKNSVLLLRVLKLLDNAICDLETLCQMHVVSPPIFHKEKRALAKPIRSLFLDISIQAKKFHSERKKCIRPQVEPVSNVNNGVLNKRWSVEWVKGLFPHSSLYTKN